METKLLYGKPIRDDMENAMRQELSTLPSRPRLVIVQVGSRPESNSYIRQKKLFGERAGFEVVHDEAPESVTTEDLVRKIEKWNAEVAVTGLIVQLPLPEHIDKNVVLESIAPEKDVDGMTSKNLKLLWSGSSEGFIPATAQGILTLLERYDIPVEGKHAVIIGRSELVGKPLALALLARNATVTITHRHTKGLSAIARGADILIAAAGSPGLVNESHVSPGQTIIDVGITPAVGEGATRLVGDVDLDAVQGFVAAITPVPGGVGPMTVASLFSNVLKAYRRKAS